MLGSHSGRFLGRPVGGDRPPGSGLASVLRPHLHAHGQPGSQRAGGPASCAHWCSGPACLPVVPRLGLRSCGRVPEGRSSACTHALVPGGPGRGVWNPSAEPRGDCSWVHSFRWKPRPSLPFQAGKGEVHASRAGWPLSQVARPRQPLRSSARDADDGDGDGEPLGAPVGRRPVSPDPCPR